MRILRKLFLHRQEWVDQFGVPFAFGRVNCHPMFFSFGESYVWCSHKDKEKHSNVDSQQNVVMDIDSELSDNNNHHSNNTNSQQNVVMDIDSELSDNHNHHSNNTNSQQNVIMDIDGEESEDNHNENVAEQNGNNQKETGCWKLKAHPNQMYFWMFTDLKTRPCRVNLYRARALKQFISKPLHVRQRECQQKVIKKCPGWKIATYQAIIELSELSCTKKKRALLKYYGQNGVRKAPKKQTLTPGTVSSANLFIGKRRQRMHQAIIRGEANYEHFPVQARKDTVHRKLTTFCYKIDINFSTIQQINEILGEMKKCHAKVVHTLESIRGQKGRF